MEGRNQRWLLVKMSDAEADASHDPVSEHPGSAVPGRSLEEIGEGKS
jgi:hypothetical protein